MELLHIYNDNSRLYKMSARSLIQIPIWKGNRILDIQHAQNINDDINGKAYLLDSGYKIIKYTEYDNENRPIKKWYLNDGQHRAHVVSNYFEKHVDAKDFIVTVTEINVESEEDAIIYFNKINNVKPIQFEEDSNMIINKYLVKLCVAFPKNKNLIRNTATKRPYLSVDKFREYLQKYIHELKKVPVELFVRRCLTTNERLLNELSTYDKTHKEHRLISRILELQFALAWDDRFLWLKEILK